MALFDTSTVEFPDDGKVDIRELSVGQLREADQKGTEDMAALLKSLPDRIIDKTLERQRDEAVERLQRFEGYDPDTLLRYGITGWSYEEPCDDANKTQLGARKGDVVARAIFDLSVIPEGKGAASSPNSDRGESNVRALHEAGSSTPREAP
jgi:hypothetical protein